VDNLLWAAGGAAVVYLLWVRPLQLRAAAESSGGAGARDGMTAAELAGASVGQAGLGVAGSAKSGGCGCGG
jgi:hypothetical protein